MARQTPTRLYLSADPSIGAQRLPGQCLGAASSQTVFGLPSPTAVGGARKGPRATVEFAATTQFLSTLLGRRLPEEQRSLVAVAAEYAALALRHDYKQDQVACAYPFFLLAAWLWHDVVDSDCDVSPGDSFLQRGLRAITSAATGRPEGWGSSPPSMALVKLDPLLWSKVELCTKLMDQARQCWVVLARGYEQSIEHEAVRCFQSLMFKRPNLQACADGGNVHSVCVGIEPFYEMSFAFKARGAGISALELRSFVDRADVAQCTRTATQHCLAVNRLFSAVPAGSSAQLNEHCACVDEAELSPRSIGRLYHRFRQQALALQTHPCGAIVVQTCEHLMDGNLRFHLNVPRHPQSPKLVRDLWDPSALGMAPAELFNWALPAQETGA